MKHLNNQKVLIGLSGGINSAAVVCWLIENGIQPKEVHLFYAHFTQHSPDTFRFVVDIIRYARKHLKNVYVKITKNDIINFFESENIIPHPANSPCSKRLKIDAINTYAFDNGLTHDLVGYVKHEFKRRTGRQQKTMERTLFSLEKEYPIGGFTDEWCFEITKRHIGWYPKIYDQKWNDPGFVNWVKENLYRWPEEIQSDLLSRIGTDERVFKHNNCLPCKNMYTHEIICVEYFYPEYHKQAMGLSVRLQKYWGRNQNEFYTTFGRDLGQESTCETCKW